MSLRGCKLLVGLLVKHYWYSIGRGEYLHSFFSTISYHLETDGWGSKYSNLLKTLYDGIVDPGSAPQMLEEVKEIQQLLAGFRADQIVWEIEDPSACPADDARFNPHATSLADVFITVENNDLIDYVISAIEDAIGLNYSIIIHKL